MDTELILMNGSPVGRHRANASSTIRNLSNRKTVSTRIRNPEEPNTIVELRRWFHSFIWSRNMVICSFVLFVIIAKIIGVLIVCLTTPKPNTTCDLTFKRVGKSSLILSSQPRSVAVGDLNNDNRTDIVVANSGTSTIEIFLSNGNGTFSNQNTYSTNSQSNPYSIVVDDFNNDNYLDIAVANYDANNIGIFLGHGNGMFDDQSVFSTGSSRPLFIAVGDFNNDNRSDISVANYGTNNFGIFLGNGNGSFQAQTTYSTGYDSLPYSLAIGDFNKDNNLDIAVASYGTDNIEIFLGYGNGSFASEKIYTTTRNSKPSSIAVGDFNNDTQLDIVVANYGIGNIGIFLGHGDGTFGIQTTYEIDSKSQPQFIAVGYFDNNNYLDVVVVDSINNQVHIILGCGNGSFATLTTYNSIVGAIPFSVAVDNFDNDNHSDIAVVNYGTHNLLVLDGYSSVPSASITPYFLGQNSFPTSLVIYDFNNDSYLDIAVNNANNNSIVILIGTNNGTFVTGETYSTGDKSVPQYICIGDLNNDHRMDIVIANKGNDCVGILFGQNNGTFANVITYSTGIGSSPWYVALGDVNNDNNLDIISANTGSHNIGVLLGYGNTSFADIKMYSIGSTSVPWSVAVGDVNKDNYLDIVVSITIPDSAGVFLGYGNGTFGTMTAYSAGLNALPFALTLADFNRDNNLDIAMTETNAANLGIFLGNGDGTFRTQVTYSTGSGSLPYCLTVTDFNNDGYYDIAVTNFGANDVVIFFGDGNGSFQLARTYSTGPGSNAYGIGIADLNKDGILEVIVTDAGTGYVAVLTQYYAAEFANQTTYPTGSAPHPYSLAIGDFDNDNLSDVVVANSDTNDLSILFGLGNGTFGTPITYSIATNSYPQYVITGDINQDNHIDILVANSNGNTISLIMGYGNRTFASEMVYTTGDDSNPYGIVISDFNNDHRLDFAVANKGADSVGIFFGFDYGSFQNQTTFSNNNSLEPYYVFTMDFNNDNYLDIAAVFQKSDYLAILLGRGDGNFADMTIYSTGANSNPYMLVVSDFNNDGRLDIAVSNYGTDSLGIFLGYGNGNFATMVTYSTGPQSYPSFFAVGDFNNDHVTDIVIINSNNNTISIYQGYGNGNFTFLMTYSTGNSSLLSAVAVGNLNNDDRLDIVVTNYGSQTVGIFFGNGNGSFQSQVTYSTGYQSGPSWVVIADLNNDSQSDIATSNFNVNNVGILFGHGNGTFSNVVVYSTGDGSRPQCLGIGDFNNDKIVDIAVANYGANTVAVLFGLGDGTFLLGASYSTGTGSVPISLAIGDFNNDTRLDIAVANYLSNNIGVFLGYGYQPFAVATIYTTGGNSQPHSVAVGDFNNDGWSDIVVANYGTDNVGILLGHGSSIFDTMITYTTGADSAPYAVAVGDFNNDNQSDIVVANSGANNIAILLGSGNATFVMVANYSTGARSSPYAVAINHLNNDTILDIVVTDFSTSTILIFYGNGNGTFGGEMSYALGYGYSPDSVAVTDLNQDKRMDIVIACYNTDNIETIMNTC